MLINKYKLHFNDLGYLIGFEAVLDDSYDYVGQMSQFPDACRGWTKFVNGEFVEDETKKAEITDKEAKDVRKSELHKLLDDSDYLVARTFEQVMALNNPVTFITDLIQITAAFKNKYADVITNRQAWRDELEELEVLNEQ